ncbi:MAG: fluoride efflux transporter CrcB [Gammaproteobacteria bacterium]|nr:fluoride efflux transporter CrcB [Gammaproteobacteria bacterium]
MNHILAIAAGGALGAVSRYLVSNGVHLLAGRGFPYGTLTVNVVGSLLMGFLYIVLIERLGVESYWRAIILVGFLGAFTTFSTFSIETLNLIENGELSKAMINVLASVVTCITACWLGLMLGRQL